MNRLTGTGRTGTLDGTEPLQAEVLPALTAQNVCHEKKLCSIHLYQTCQRVTVTLEILFHHYWFFFGLEVGSWFVDITEPTEHFIFLP